MPDPGCQKKVGRGAELGFISDLDLDACFDLDPDHKTKKIYALMFITSAVV